jgi:hypothetical protein
MKLYSLTFALHLAQPLARLWGRTRHGLTALRAHVPGSFTFPRPRHETIWTETWLAPEQALERIAHSLRADGAPLVIGGDYDRWDLEVRGGALGAVRLFMTHEEHGSGKLLFRFRSWPKCSGEVLVAALVLTGLSLGAALDEYWLAYDILALFTLVLIGRIAYECGTAQAAIRRVLKQGFAQNK